MSKIGNIYVKYLGCNIVIGFVDKQTHADGVSLDVSAVIPICRELQKQEVKTLEGASKPLPERVDEAPEINADIQLTVGKKRIKLGYVYSTGDCGSTLIYHVKLDVDVVMQRFDRQYCHLHTNTSDEIEASKETEVGIAPEQQAVTQQVADEFNGVVNNALEIAATDADQAEW